MVKPKNIVFEQLRWDYLSCAEHPHLSTPNIYALPTDGVRFSRVYVQSHGATWTRLPLKVGERSFYSPI